MNKNLVIAGVVVIGLGLFWQLNRSSNDDPTNIIVTTTGESAKVKLVSPQEFARLAKGGEVFMLDVHTPEQTHIPGTDELISYDQIGENANRLPEDKSIPILVYCRSGSMSAKAASEIAELGYASVYDLDGGTNAYKEQQVSVALWPSKQDLGIVIYGDVATTDFTLTNYTPLPTRITRVSTSCGCTKASVEKETLEAYESTTVNVTFDPAVHKDDTDLGNLSRTIYIETDNPNYPELESIITATVVKNN